MDNNAEEILKFIARAPQGRSFYQIVRGFGFPDAPYNLIEILGFFVKENLAELIAPEDEINAKYLITQKGHQLLENSREKT